MALHESTLATLKKYADIHVQSAQQTFGITLDYSEDSVATLDKMISDGWKGELPQSLDGVVGFFGSYLGEVIIRNLNGHWIEKDGVFSVQITMADGSTGDIAVFAKVKKRFTNGQTDSLGYFYQGLKQAQTGNLSTAQ